jgi:hypothetical protein
MEREVVCPSGLTGVVRGLRGKQVNLFTTPKPLHRGELVTTILNDCWLETTDFGPYAELEGGSDAFSWIKALTGDRYVAAIGVRIASYGPVCEWEEECQNLRCEQGRFPASVNLEEDLHIQELSPSSRAKFISGEPFEMELPVSGKTVKYKLQTGEDEARISKLIRNPEENVEENTVTISLAVGIQEIEGVHVNDKIKWLENADGGDILHMLEQLNEVECGVETAIELTCRFCRRSQEVELPLGAEAFWFPRKRRKRFSSFRGGKKKTS